jgi:hypothetical protein
MDGTQIEISRGRADEAMRTQVAALVNSLDGIATELRSRNPDRSRIQQVFDSLKGTWVPGIIIGVLSNVLSGAVGL